MLVYGHKLDHGGFPVAAKIGDVNPSYTTDCRSIDSSCKVSAKVQQDVQKKFYNHKQLHPTVRTQISIKDVKLVALLQHKG